MGAAQVLGAKSRAHHRLSAAAPQSPQIGSGQSAKSNSGAAPINRPKTRVMPGAGRHANSGAARAVSVALRDQPALQIRMTPIHSGSMSESSSTLAMSMTPRASADSGVSMGSCNATRRLDCAAMRSITRALMSATNRASRAENSRLVTRNATALITPITSPAIHPPTSRSCAEKVWARLPSRCAHGLNKRGVVKWRFTVGNGGVAGQSGGDHPVLQFSGRLDHYFEPTGDHEQFF